MFTAKSHAHAHKPFANHVDFEPMHALAEPAPTDVAETKHAVRDLVPQAVLRMNSVVWTRGIGQTSRDLIKQQLVDAKLRVKLQKVLVSILCSPC